MLHFPTPTKISSGSTRWQLQELLAYEAAIEGRPAPILRPEENQFLNVQEVALRYASSVPTIWRWCREARSRRAQK